MNMAEDIKESRKKFEDAAQTSDLLEKARLFEEGLKQLNACLAEEDISPNERKIISKLKLTNTRHLLS
jgi:hypothetical protein